MDYVEGIADGLTSRRKGHRRRVYVNRVKNSVIVTMATTGGWQEIRTEYTPEQAVALADLIMATVRPMLPSNQKRAWNREHPHKLQEYRRKYNERLKQQRQSNDPPPYRP